MSTIPLWAWIVSITGVAGMLVAFVVAMPPRRRADTAVVIGLWVALTSVLAANGVFVQDAGTTVPWIGPTIVVALLIALAGLRAAPEASLAALTAGQSFRVVGGIFVVLTFVGALPPQFALPAGLGDLAIGVAAPFVARRLHRGDTRGARTFHVLGIVDLVVAIIVGILSAPGPYQVFTGPISTGAMTLLPLVLVPTVLVPLSIAVHLTALRRLSATGRVAVAPRPAGPVGA